MVASADGLATQAGMELLARGANAVDAAVAANAAMAVTSPHLCGMGGDLFALVHTSGTVDALDSSGRAASGTTADDLRAAGLAEVGVAGEDLVIGFVENTAADWSFGFGRAQYVTGELATPGS